MNVCVVAVKMWKWRGGVLRFKDIHVTYLILYSISLLAYTANSTPHFKIDYLLIKRSQLQSEVYVEYVFSPAMIRTWHLGTWRTWRKVRIAEVAAVGLIHCKVWPAATPSDGKCATVPWLRWRGLLWHVEVEVEMEVTLLSQASLPLSFMPLYLVYPVFILISARPLFQGTVLPVFSLMSVSWGSFIHWWYKYEVI